MAEHCHAECHLCRLSLMLSITYDHFMLIVVILSAVAPYRGCHWKGITIYNAFEVY